MLANHSPVPMRELYECQLRCLKNKSHRCRWHPEILTWCADVWRTDRRAYEQMANGNVLILPHPDTVRKYCSSAVAQPGHNIEECLDHHGLCCSPSFSGV